MSDSLAPHVKLAIGCAGFGPESFVGKALQVRAPTIKLAHHQNGQGDNVLSGIKGNEQLPDDALPSLLISYYYIAGFLKFRHSWAYRDWVLDSGAFSAKNSGAEIDLDTYIAQAKDLMASDPKLTEIFSLDVIGDWRASEANTKKMWAAGIPAIPTYHYREPFDVLRGLARDYDKIAIGGLVGLRQPAKRAFMMECFARVWPKKIHGFGINGRRILFELPFHSVDATNWEIGPVKFGMWQAFGVMSVRGSKQNLRSEVEHYLRLERELQSRWKKEMAQLENHKG